MSKEGFQEIERRQIPWERKKREILFLSICSLSLQWMIKQKNKSHSSSELLHKSFLYESFHSPLSDPSQTFPLFFSPFLSLKKEERCSLFPVPLPSLAPLFPFQDPRSSFLDSLLFFFSSSSKSRWIFVVKPKEKWDQEERKGNKETESKGKRKKKSDLD